MRSRVYISTFSGATIITHARAKSVNLSVSLFLAWVFVGKLINALTDSHKLVKSRQGQNSCKLIEIAEWFKPARQSCGVEN